MAQTFHVTIARVGEQLFSGDAVALHVPAEEGMLTILAHHEAYVAPLVAGAIRVESAAGETHTIDLAAPGILEVSGNQATVLL